MGWAVWIRVRWTEPVLDVHGVSIDTVLTSSPRMSDSGVATQGTTFGGNVRINRGVILSKLAYREWRMSTILATEEDRSGELPDDLGAVGNAGDPCAHSWCNCRCVITNTPFCAFNGLLPSQFLCFQDIEVPVPGIRGWVCFVARQFVHGSARARVCYLLGSVLAAVPANLRS